MPTSHSIRPIRTLEAYFGAGAIPVVVQEFRPGRGWRRTSWRKRISGAWATKLRREGITSVALELDGRVADFRIDELTPKAGLRG